MSPPPSPHRHRRRMDIYAKTTVSLLLSFTLFFFYPVFSPPATLPANEDRSEVEFLPDYRHSQARDAEVGVASVGHGGEDAQHVEAAAVTRLAAEEEERGGAERNTMGAVSKLSGNNTLYTGIWIQDMKGPIYDRTCRWIGNIGKDCKFNKNNGENYWRWQPKDDDLEDFQPTSFLELLKGKTIAFVGDEGVEYQVRSLLCLLSQVATIKEEEEKGALVRWRLMVGGSMNVTVVWVRSKMLVQWERIKGGKGGNMMYKKVRVDKVEEMWAEAVATEEAEVVVVGTEAMVEALAEEPTSYVAGREEVLVGCHRCKELSTMDNNNNYSTSVSPMSSFRTIVRSVVLAMGGLPGFSGTTFFLPPPHSPHPQFSASRFSLAIRREIQLHCRRQSAHLHNSSRMFLLPLLPSLPPSSSCLPHPFFDAYNHLLFHYLRKLVTL